MLKKFTRDRRGVTAVEYGLIVAMIALAVVGGFSNASGALASLWGDNDAKLQQALQENR